MKRPRKTARTRAEKVRRSQELHYLRTALFHTQLKLEALTDLIEKNTNQTQQILSQVQMLNDEIKEYEKRLVDMIDPNFDIPSLKPEHPSRPNPFE